MAKTPEWRLLQKYGFACLDISYALLLATIGGFAFDAPKPAIQLLFISTATFFAAGLNFLFCAKLERRVAYQKSVQRAKDFLQQTKERYPLLFTSSDADSSD